MPFPQGGSLPQFGVITFTCSHLRISGFVFLLRSSCRCFHVISIKHGELALIPMTSISFATFEKLIQKWISHTPRKWATPWRPWNDLDLHLWFRILDVRVWHALRAPFRSHEHQGMSGQRAGRICRRASGLFIQVSISRSRKTEWLSAVCKPIYLNGSWGTWCQTHLLRDEGHCGEEEKGLLMSWQHHATSYGKNHQVQRTPSLNFVHSSASPSFLQGSLYLRINFCIHLHIHGLEFCGAFYLLYSLDYRILFHVLCIVHLRTVSSFGMTNLPDEYQSFCLFNVQDSAHRWKTGRLSM